MKDNAEAEVLGIDDRQGRLYFVAEAEPSQNKTWGVLGYELETEKLTSLGGFNGGGLGPVVTSPSGRYIALGVVIHSGMCPNSYLGIVDTQDKRVAEVITWAPSSADPLVNRAIIKAIHWIDPGNLEYQAQMYDSAVCFAGRNSAEWPVSGTVDVRKEKFH